MMRTFSDLIVEWLNGHPSRTSASLARLTGLSTGEISQLLHGRSPSMEVAFRLGLVLPAPDVRDVMCESNPSCQKFFIRLSTPNLAS